MAISFQKLNDIESLLTSISSDISTLKTDVSTLKTQMTTANSKISTLQTSMNTANSNLTSLTNKINDVSNYFSIVAPRQTSLSLLDAYAGSGSLAATYLGTVVPIRYNNSTYFAQVIGINQDDKANGSGKATFTLMFCTNIGLAKPMENTSKTSSNWSTCDLRAWLNGDFFSAINLTDSQFITQVKKKYVTSGTTISTCNDKIWLLARSEIESSYTTQKEGDLYSLFNSMDKSLLLNKPSPNSQDYENKGWWLRTKWAGSGSTTYSYILNPGSDTPGSSGSGIAFNNYIVPCFCVG